MATTIEVGSITFNDKTVDPYYTADIEGWSSPPTRLTTIDRVAADGAVIGDNRNAARTIGLSGFIVATTNTLAWSGLNSLEDALDLVTADGTLVVNEPTAKQATVRRAGPLRVRWRSHRIVEFSVELVAVDPRKYAASQSSATTS